MKETGSYLLDVLFMGGLITGQAFVILRRRKIPDGDHGISVPDRFCCAFLDAAAFYIELRLFAGASLLLGCRFLWQLYAGREQSAAGMSRLMAAGGFFLGIVAVWEHVLRWNGACRGILSVPDVTSENGRERAKVLHLDHF